MTNVVDIADFKRVRAEDRVTSLVEAGESAREQTFTATMIGCAGCEGTKFELLDDGRVMCAGCHTLIRNLRWFDNGPTSPAA